MSKDLIGKKIRIKYMSGETKYIGREGIVESIDDMGQLHGTWGGLAVIPGEDDYEVISKDDSEERKTALAINLKLNDEESSAIKKDETETNVFKIGKCEYLVLTEEEADKQAKECIENELWAFNADFILRHNKNCDDLSNWEWDQAIQTIKEAQGKLAEGLNGLMRCLISDLEEFKEDAICEDGRGQFLSTYDGREEEETVNGKTYYIYKVNETW